MAVRHRRKPCGNCPQPVATVIPLKPQTERPPLPKTVQAIYQVPVDEGLRLWKHVCFGTSTCIQMIEGYALMQMPGDPSEAIKQMRDRLIAVLTALESRNEIDPPAERPVPSSPDNGDSPGVGDDIDAGRQPPDDGTGSA